MFVNQVLSRPLPRLPRGRQGLRVEALALKGHAWRLHQFLTPAVVRVLAELGGAQTTQAVGNDGILAHYGKGDLVGSYRASVFEEGWAAQLWARMQGVLSLPTHFDDKGHTDWDGHPHWRAVGVNPLFRFIRYSPAGGVLVPHYDAPYVASDTQRTLFSFLLYLSDSLPGEGGRTRFLHDPQDARPFKERIFKDWTKAPTPQDIALPLAPRAGDALVFEHRLLHDSEMLTALARQDKLVVRTDIFFEKA